MTQRASAEPIAIVGIGCRFPGGVNDPASFWRLLCEGTTAITETPASRFDVDRFFDERPATPGRVMTRWGGYLDHLDELDAGFFGLSPREAERLDPAQRLLLEVTWEAFEDAGQNVARLDGSNTGVFVGQWLSDFESRLFEDPEGVDFYMTTGSGRYASSGRLSYVFGLQGPSLTLDTACSSSLAAIHLACQSLRAGECGLAVAGGVNVILQPQITIAYSQSRMMAPDGRCKFGDADADGYVRSEGAGIVVLKPLSRATADGDRIYAVIRGSAVNNDGHSSGSLGTPSQVGQEALLRAAYRDAGVSPVSVGYVEAHGTGTRTGDPVELGALGAVLGDGRGASRPLLVGSVKTNIGHTEGAAGVAGLIKATLSLHHGVIPPSLHCRTLNPAIPWRELAVEIPRARTEWTDARETRVAGVSAFGIAGTNAHVVLSGAPETTVAQTFSDGEAYLLVLSARSREALAELAAGYAALVDDPHGPALADLCASAALHRTALEFRAAFVAGTHAELIDRLRRFAAGEADAAQAHGQNAEERERRIAFVFPGQGSQWIGMARELVAHEPTFRASMERIEDAMRGRVEWSLMAQLHAEENDPAFRLDDISVIQPVLLAVEIALADWWRARGVMPSAIVGHSLGEVGAAHAAGALTLEQAMSIACARSTLMRRTSGKGAMAVVELSMEAAAARLSGYVGRVSLAVSNGPGSTVISGDPDAIAELLVLLEREGVFCRPVKVDVASHSPQMDPLVPELVASQAALAPMPTTTTLYSTVDACRIDGTAMRAEYWGRNLREPVRFAQTIDAMLADGVDTFIEMSPHPALLASITQVGGARGVEPLALQSLRRREPERQRLLITLGELFAAGHPVEWTAVFGRERVHVDLPRYPWQRDRYWLEPRAATAATRRGSNGFLHSHLVSSTAADTHFWDADISVAAWPYLAEHVVNSMVVIPAAAFIEMALEAAAALGEAAGGTLLDVTIENALVLSENGSRGVQVAIEPGPVGLFAFTISSRSGDGDGEWTTHARGMIRPSGDDEQRVGWSAPPSEARLVTADSHYEEMRSRGLDYGGSFRGVRELHRTATHAWARVVLSDDVPRVGHRIHPALLDACLQLGLSLLPSGRETYVPVSLERLRWYTRVDQRSALQVRAVRHSRAPDDRFSIDIALFDPSGAPVAEIDGIAFARLGQSDAAAEDSFFAVAWHAQPALPENPTAVGQDADAWLLLADSRGVAAALTARLGASANLVAFAEESVARVSTSPARAVVHLWSLDAQSPEQGIETLHRANALGCLSALELVQAIAARGDTASPRLFLVTAGAQAVVDGDVPVVEQAPLWGLGRVIANEHPELRCTLVDLSRNPTAEEVAALARELEADGADDQVAFRGTGRFVARLEHVHVAGPAVSAPQTSRASGRPFRVEISTPGILEGLVLRPRARTSPGPGKVEIEVEASGLNFMNVMSALGIYPGYPNGVGPLGIECAGRIAAVGPDVHGFALGDTVMAIALDSLGTHAVTDARLVRRVPNGMPSIEAATFPIAFATAHYALDELARVEQGERVLIHAATGGVGLAAVQLARHVGAEVYATAGTPEKREFLAALGVRHVMDSRSLAFSEQVMERSNGEGVDVVLNSLAGEFIPAGLATLRSHGRFVEIGKRDIYRNARIGLLPFQKNLSYFAVDLDRMIRERPAHVSRILGDVVGLLEQGAVRSLPVTEFGVSRAADAFHVMARAAHMGKVAISLRDEGAVLEELPESLAATTAGTCAITGGLGGLGLAVAGRLVQRGAKDIALIGRRAPGPAERAAIADLESAGATVRVFSANVALPDDVRRVFGEIASAMPPLSAVIHAAGVLDDGILTQLTPERFVRVLAPKVQGAWNLQSALTRHPDVQLILFSSVASLLGLAGQGNYAAGNAFLDSLAHYRRAHGGRSTVINWGPWSEIGLAAETSARGSRLAARGLDSVTPREGLDALERVVDGRCEQIAVMRLDWPAYADAHPVATRASFLQLLGSSMSSDAPSGARSAREVILSVDVGPRRRAAMESFLKEQVGRVLRQSANRIETSKPFRSLGLDSLMGLELRNRLEAEFAVQLPATIVWNYPTVSALAPHLAELLGIPLDVQEQHGSAAGAASEDLEALLREIEQMSPDEARARLEQDDTTGPQV